MSEKLFEPLREYECKGKMIIDSVKSFNVDFLCKQLRNGIISGEIRFVDAVSWKDIIGLFKKSKEFELTGIDKESATNLNIVRCIITETSEKIEREYFSVSAKFVALEAIQNPHRMFDQPKNELVIDIGVLNVDETFQVSVDTTMGKLRLYPLKGYKEILPIVRSYEIATVTAIVKIFVKNPNPKHTFKRILLDAENVIQDFLQITSLAQTCYHSYCYVGILEKMKDSDKFQLVLIKMFYPKIKKPTYRGLTVPAHSSEFIKSAYKGYSRELNDLYGFDLALEWYLESNLASVLESKYLSACTCLEILVDRYKTQSETKFILDRKLFRKQLFPILEETARKFLKATGASDEQCHEICGKLLGLNRASLKSGIVALLNQLGVRYDDLFEDLQDVITIRNKIIHEGIYADRVGYVDYSRVSYVYNRLFVMLARVFLSILNYDDEYYDWIHQEFIPFNKVCVKRTI